MELAPAGPVLALQFLFNAGLSLAARIGARVTDVSQLTPFLLRTWMYCSGLFYSIDRIAHGHAPWLGTVLHLELRERAGTVFLVSHSHSVIRETCNRAIWLDKGLITMDGPASVVVGAYEAST